MEVDKLRIERCGTRFWALDDAENSIALEEPVVKIKRNFDGRGEGENEDVKMAGRDRRALFDLCYIKYGRC
ncbi:hypothetical protein L2E82_01764 [Cichorium intybus]|uniref:Uncharacterized protein n=1 Tax=Cichorium intybus TaxID=13427 RepID=A0ACB9H124_CICIN|nr:hypothetical protein L2E82_01764 [Cichorium intybus]